MNNTKKFEKIKSYSAVLYLQIYIVYTDEDSNDHKNDKNHADQTGLGEFPNVTIINGFYFIVAIVYWIDMKQNLLQKKLSKIWGFLEAFW